MRRTLPLVAALAALAGLAACGTDTKDFQEQGEKFVEGDDVRERFGMVRMSDAECQEPQSTDKDETFTCVATGSDGNTWQFTIEITGDTSMRMTSGEVIVPASPDATADTGPAPGTGAATAPTTITPTSTAPTSTVTTAATPAVTASPTAGG